MAKKKAHGDVLGLSRTPVRAKAKGAKKTSRRRITGIEVGPPRGSVKRAGVVGGVRGRGR